MSIFCAKLSYIQPVRNEMFIANDNKYLTSMEIIFSEKKCFENNQIMMKSNKVFTIVTRWSNRVLS